MICTFVPPYPLQRIALRAGTRHASTSGSQTLQVDDRLRARRQLATGSNGRSTPARPKTRVVHTADNTESLPGEVVRSDGDPPVGDPAVDEAFDSSGQLGFVRQPVRAAID